MKIINSNTKDIFDIIMKRETKKGCYSTDGRFFSWDIWQPEK